MSVRDIMTPDPAIIAGDALVTEAADLMAHHQVRRLPVVNEQGVVVGIVAQADLATKVLPRDPALIGWVAGAISRPGALVH